MSVDWAADVKKYVPNADDNVIGGIIRHCGIALQTRDASLVSFSDPAELNRVRESFLKKKLGLTLPDDQLDQAIAAVGERMKGETFRNRVTVYYLLAEHFGMLDIFNKAGVGHVGSAEREGLAAVAGAAKLGSGVSGVASSGYAAETGKPNRRWLWLLLGLLALLALLWLLHSCQVKNASTTAAAPALPAPPTDQPAPEPAIASAPAEGTVAIPEGAGVTTETRDGKPVVKVYFASGKADVVPAFAQAAKALNEYLAARAGSSLVLSGYADKTGNAALNAELSKNRAKAVREELLKAGIADTAVALVKPSDVVDAKDANAAARRVEVTIK
ncbi:MAG TPA: DUF2853 family protein [Sphingomonas sp.]